MGSERDDTSTLDPAAGASVELEAPAASDASEAIAEMLGDPLPPDWQESVAIERRQDCLAGAAYGTADAALEFITVRVELRRRGKQGSADDPEVNRVMEALFDLDRAWRTYVHDTQRDDAAQVVFEAAEYWAGATIATLVEVGLAFVWEDRRQRSGG